jgi:Protein of unknown function (DUF2971)
MIDEDGNVAHYSRLEHLANILHDKQIKPSTVASLADPRESSLDWIESEGIGPDISQEDKDSFKNLKLSVGEQLRIFCTARMKENSQQGSCPIESSIYGRPRMWSQYGENSRGFCVVLNIDELSQRMETFVKQREHLLSGSVSYFDWIHLVNGGSTIQYGSLKQPEKSLFEKINDNEMLQSIYFKKSIDWEHENEYRWLLYSESKEPICVPIVDAVKAVVLGCKFPQNQRSQAQMYCKDLGCPCYILEYQHPRYHLQQI